MRLLSAAGVALCTATVLAGLAVPASADTAEGISPTSWAYTDSAGPRTTFVNPAGDAPVGTQVFATGAVHTTRAYFTYDLSRFAGTAVDRVIFHTDEKQVADCSTPRAAQLWLTATATAPTWAKPPAERTQGGGTAVRRRPMPVRRPGMGCHHGGAGRGGRRGEEGDVRAAAADSQQGDPSLFRVFDHAPRLDAIYDHAPGKPTNLQVIGQACGAKPVLVGGYDQVKLTTTPSDPDNDLVGLEFDWWPVAHPDQVTAINSSSCERRPDRSEHPRVEPRRRRDLRLASAWQ